MINKTSGSPGRYADLRRRLIFLLLALIVYRVGTHVPVLGIDPSKLDKSAVNGFAEMLNMFTGGAFSQASLFALGIMPYISASIIVQLMTSVYPPFEALKREGATGQRKITQYTRYGALLLSVVQGFFIAKSWVSSGIVFSSDFTFYALSIISLAAGTMFLMWLGEQITERGLGNGVSILITAGIVAGLPSALKSFFSLASSNQYGAVFPLVICLAIPAIMLIVVFVERGQRKIVVNYAKRQVGNKIYGGQASHLPLKINVAGVIPPIFASSLLLLPSILTGYVSKDSLWGFGEYLNEFAGSLQPGQPLHMIVFATLIIFFCFFYTGLVFNSRETADNLKKSGAYIPGIRPGDQTSKYIDKILMRLTLIGGIYIALVCLLPEFLNVWQKGLPFHFGGTSLLIVVVVTMDFMAQVQNYLVTQKYENVLKKANFKK